MLVAAFRVIEIPIATRVHEELVDITDAVSDAIVALGVEVGVVAVLSPHTTAGIIVNEGHDPDVARDLLYALDRIVPTDGYHHAEGNSAAHVKVALVGSAQLVPVQDGNLTIGRWQRIFFAEFDGPRPQRTVEVRLAG